MVVITLSSLYKLVKDLFLNLKKNELIITYFVIITYGLGFSRNVKAAKVN